MSFFQGFKLGLPLFMNVWRKFSPKCISSKTMLSFFLRRSFFSLLEIRSRFQHTWLSRNIASTLPNALKIFDNLFRALLPPSLQDYGKNLL